VSKYTSLKKVIDIALPAIIHNLPCIVEVKINQSKSLDQSEMVFGVYFSCAFLESIFQEYLLFRTFSCLISN
jgi:metal-sulfur cluster biosynthetic enzyme